MEKQWKQCQTLFFGAPKSMQMILQIFADFADFCRSADFADSDCSHEIKRHLTPWKESCDQPRQHIKKQRHHFANKGPSGQSYGFYSGHVWM